MQPAAAQSFILDKLSHELRHSLSYHNVTHSEQVMQHAALLAEAEGITGDALDLLLTAASFHDAGFLEKYTGHEEVSCRLAREYLPQFDYSATETDKVCELIMATKVPQNAPNKLAEILCDADLYYLGTDDYGHMAENLYTEFLLEDIVKDKMEWQRQQIAFLKAPYHLTIQNRQPAYY
jgi:uncharacterized protein